MESINVYYEIAQEMNVPNEHVHIDSSSNGYVNFHLYDSNTSYSARLTKNGKNIKKNSIRINLS